jgi:hypothetical protein
MYCGKRSHWAGICRKRNSDSNSGRSKSSDNGRRPTGRTKPKKTEYKKAKERGKSYTDKNNKKIDGNASKGARSSQQKRSNVNMVHLVEEEEDSAAPSCNSIATVKNTPKLIIRINGNEQKIAATPDTGVCLSLISPSWIDDFDLWHMVDTSAPDRLSTATGGRMDVRGTINLLKWSAYPPNPPVQVHANLSNPFALFVAFPCYSCSVFLWTQYRVDGSHFERLYFDLAASILHGAVGFAFVKVVKNLAQGSRHRFSRVSYSLVRTVSNVRPFWSSEAVRR